MADIASALFRLSDAIIKAFTPKPYRTLEPFTVTPTTDALPVFKDQPGVFGVNKMYWIGFFVRNMGTATYVRIGTQNALVDSLLQVQAYTEYDAPNNGYINGSELFIISDTADAVIEVTGVRVE